MPYRFERYVSGHSSGVQWENSNRTAPEIQAKHESQPRIPELKTQRNDLGSINAIYVMNRLKGDSLHFCSLLENELEHVSIELSETASHSVEAQEAARCLAIARTKMQEACMWACRAVARPDADC